MKKVAEAGRGIIVKTKDPAMAEAVIAAAEDVIIDGADAENWEAMNAAVKDHGVLGVTAGTPEEFFDLAEKLEKAGNKKLIFDVTAATVKQTFANAVQIRRAALTEEIRTLGYPSIVDLSSLAPDDLHMQTALASVFTSKYGSIIVMDRMGYAESLPLYGLRQNIFTDPQRPMKVEPGIYPINGADENSLCLTTVDFALTYFVVSGELERSGVPCNLIINDAGGLSVLTSWAAGKFSSSSIAKYFQEADIEGKIKCRKLCIPGKVAVLKGELEAKLPGWEIIVAPREAVQLVKFLKDMQ